MLTNEFLNEDMQSKHINGNKDDKNGCDANLQSNPTIVMQSQTNPKVKVTLEFPDKAEQNERRKVKEELEQIMKNNYLKKFKMGLSKQLL